MLWVAALPHRVLLVAALWGNFVCYGANDDEFKTVDVAKLANITHGTELALLDNAYRVEKTYKLEDFFWTGSGDGPEDVENTETPNTIYKTKTVLSTVYVDHPSTHVNQTNVETTTKCSFNCEGTSIPEGAINPTPTITTEGHQGNSTDEADESADRQFWLLTVLKSDGKDPVILDLKNNLAKLYKTAFHRQQERHLGISTRRKRELARANEPVNVYIHNVAKSTNGDEKIEVLYHVSVSGKPVDANTAAADMTLVSDEEVIHELGYPFLVKAEPYLKASEAQELSTSKGTWLFIGSSLSILILLLLTVAFLSLCLNKRKKNQMGTENRQHVFGDSGQENLAFVDDQNAKKDAKRKHQSPTYINFRTEPTNRNDQGVLIPSRPGSSISCSTTSGSSMDISPLMGLHNQRRHSLKKPPIPRPKAGSNKTTPLEVDRRRISLAESDSSVSSTRKNSPSTIYIGQYDPGIISPKSYLSMPSIKSFPRGNIPEPLNKVLEPVSVLHLDLPEDSVPEEHDFMPKRYRSSLVRHGSMGTEEDPGVIGPVVWNLHCQRLQHGVSVDEGMDDIKIGSNMTRMRKRFHDLLDDTFSLFGSRRDSPNEGFRPPPIEVKSHSAVISLHKKNDEVQATIRPRPKTSDPRRVVQTPGSEPPKGAWASKAPSPMVRPLSAGHFQTPIFTPRVDVDLVLAEGRFQPNDPAIPLIAAIKDEIGKCSLPGSTTNLAQ